MLHVEGMALEASDADWWTLHRGESPVLATAIHNGHGVRPELAPRMALAEADRLREEDPFTEFAIRDVPNRIACHRSRFEVDLNRPRGEAVYLSPDQAWGLAVWDDPPPPEMVARSLRMHDHYYRMLCTVLGGLEEQFGRFVVIDVHSYNHRRAGPDAAPADEKVAPQVNIGTSSMDRGRWAHVVEPFMDRLRDFAFRGRRMDVRENVAFQGRGEQTAFVHREFPETGCAIALEFKKFFMDEWTGRPDREALLAVRAMVRSTLPLLEAIVPKGAG
jgi:hypothetical protein